jgi:hypothetical protein
MQLKEMLYILTILFFGCSKDAPQKTIDEYFNALYNGDRQRLEQLLMFPLFEDGGLVDEDRMMGRVGRYAQKLREISHSKNIKLKEMYTIVNILSLTDCERLFSDSTNKRRFADSLNIPDKVNLGFPRKLYVYLSENYILISEVVFVYLNFSDVVDMSNSKFLYMLVKRDEKYKIIGFLTNDYLVKEMKERIRKAKV